LEPVAAVLIVAVDLQASKNNLKASRTVDHHH
jgi:hypothetical protein